MLSLLAYYHCCDLKIKSITAPLSIMLVLVSSCVPLLTFDKKYFAFSKSCVKSVKGKPQADVPQSCVQHIYKKSFIWSLGLSETMNLEIFTFPSL